MGLFIFFLLIVALLMGFFYSESKIPLACANLLLYGGWHLLALLVCRSLEIPAKSCLSRRKMWPPPSGHGRTGRSSMAVTRCSHYLLHGVSVTLRAGYSPILLTESLGKLTNQGNGTCVPLHNTEDIHLSLFRP